MVDYNNINFSLELLNAQQFIALQTTCENNNYLTTF